jgi:uncharacterized protein (TIGR02246 family)
MSAAHKQVLEQVNAAILKGDFDGALKFCTDDTEWTFVGEQTLKGKDAVRQYMAANYKEPPKFLVHRMIAEGDIVAAIGEITIKDEQGKAVDNAYCDVWRLRDGKLAELRAFVIATNPPLPPM